MVFRFPDGHSSIGHGDICQRQQARELNRAQSPLVGDLHRDLVVESRRRAQARRAIISPESADERLLFRTLRRGKDSIATQVFRFVVRSCVSRACHIRRRRRAELTGRCHDERYALPPVRTQSERDQAYWVLPPVPRLVAREIIDANVRLRQLRTVIDPHGQDRCSRAMA